MENSQAKKFYQKKWFWVIAVLVLIIWISSSSSPKTATPTQDGGNTTNTETAKVEVEKVTATTLATDYEENEIAADKKYKGKTMEITGRIKDIGIILGSTYITLDGNQILSDIQCFFSKSQEAELANLKKESSLTVQGEVKGKSLNVEVRNCVIVK